MARLFGWLGRRGLVFLLLVVALVLYQIARPSYDSWRAMQAKVVDLRREVAAFPASTTAAIDRSNAALAGAEQRSRAELDRQLAQAQQARRERTARCNANLAGALLSGGAAAVVDNRRACVEGALLDREIAVLTTLRATVDARRPGETIAAARARHVAALRAAAVRLRGLNAQRRTLADQPLEALWQRRSIAAIDRSIAVVSAQGTEARRQALSLEARERALAGATAAARQAIDATSAELASFVAGREEDLSGTAAERLRGWAERVGLAGAAVTAAWLLLGIIVSPYLVRLFCFYVLAPLAMRRPRIRLRVPGGTGSVIPLAPRSTTSAGVRLEAVEELLVRQDYLQSTSAAGRHGTQWFLDWRAPVTSWATGLTFLTRIRGEGETTTISAVRDPFAEVTVLSLPDGGACVLQPRALAAVVQPTGRRLRITRHWRLFSLNAWLTLQLRYLVFHGPARLVVKGGRGVRVERAEAGRVFGQDQLIGFSADLAYAVARTETFWPYLLGREPLLKDRVLEGEGVLIVEEAPLAGRSARVRRGLEGMIDAGMKLFGM